MQSIGHIFDYLEEVIRDEIEEMIEIKSLGADGHNSYGHGYSDGRSSLAMELKKFILEEFNEP